MCIKTNGCPSILWHYGFTATKECQMLKWQERRNIAQAGSLRRLTASPTWAANFMDHLNMGYSLLVIIFPKKLVILGYPIFEQTHVVMLAHFNGKMDIRDPWPMRCLREMRRRPQASWSVLAVLAPNEEITFDPRDSLKFGNKTWDLTDDLMILLSAPIKRRKQRPHTQFQCRQKRLEWGEML